MPTVKKKSQKHKFVAKPGVSDLQQRARELGITLSQNGKRRTKSQLSAAIRYKEKKKQRR